MNLVADVDSQTYPTVDWLLQDVQGKAVRKGEHGKLGTTWALPYEAPLLGVTAWPYSMQDLETAKHDIELPRRNFLTVNLDGFQTGVGGDSSWGYRYTINTD
jgi:hypothetical protein